MTPEELTPEGKIQYHLNKAFIDFYTKLQELGYDNFGNFSNTTSPVSITEDSFNAAETNFKNALAAQMRWPIWLKMNQQT